MAKDLSPARFMRWLLESGDGASPSIRAELQGGLFASLPIFLGGIVNTIAIAGVAAWRHPVAPFTTWLLIEVAIAVLRLPVVIGGHRLLRQGRRPPVATAAVLACAWSASVGFGAWISVTSGDWVLATIVCLSAAAMVCGTCLRNFGTPRLAALMVFLTLAPCAVAGALTTEPVVAIISFQLPVFFLTIFAAAFSLHRMTVSRMNALHDLARSESFNRTILESSPDYTLILDRDGEVVFCKRPNAPLDDDHTLMGQNWLALLPPEDREAGAGILARALSGEPANLLTSHREEDGSQRWFDIVVTPVSDGSGRVILVARDITHQKTSEEQALWMARHDPLTRLPNRTVLQDHLDRALSCPIGDVSHALLIVDVDNFKTINDTLGHDAGDALLCAFAERLRVAVRHGGVVTRTGGDEFAFLVTARSDADIRAAASRIFDSLRHPFLHDGRLLDCGASIGASLLPRDGSTRSEIMKAADIALYAAKAAGRGQVKIFEPSMKAEVERREEMMAAAREALREDRVHPYFQPKVALKTGQVVGFEALLRWTDADGALRAPEDLRPAFDDPILGAAISDRMIDRTFAQMQDWNEAEVEFGHVALNATAGDFRRDGYAEGVLGRLAQRGIDTARLQIEVTETVFLGRGAGHVEAALRALSDAGVRIALDDFGTGYASLSHLNQFPVDLLKIDRSFIHGLGTSMDSEAICGAVVNLGHSLGLEIVAEGIETEAQQEQLVAFGCDTGQGFLYSPAIPAEDVPALLADEERRTGREKISDAA